MVALRERSPERKRIFPGDAASTLRALPRALPVGSGAVPYGACPRKKPFSLVSARLLVDLRIVRADIAGLRANQPSGLHLLACVCDPTSGASRREHACERLARQPH